jgi:hypothetical protein
MSTLKLVAHRQGAMGYANAQWYSSRAGAIRIIFTPNITLTAEWFHPRTGTWVELISHVPVGVEPNVATQAENLAMAAAELAYAVLGSEQ